MSLTADLTSSTLYTLLPLLFVLGLMGGILSGLLGIGGGLVIVPLLLYVPAWFAGVAIDIRTASAVAVVQVTAATLSGTIAHRRRGAVYMRLALTMSVASAIGALAGGVISAWAPAHLLLLMTAGLATFAALLMFLPARAEGPDASDRPPFRVWTVCTAGLAIGLVIGMNGAGAFLMMPALLYLVGLPTRIALGTVLAVGFPTALAASAGKIATGQAPLLLTALVVMGAIIGAQVGSWLSTRTPPRVLRWLYGALVSVIAIGLWFDIFTVR